MYIYIHIYIYTYTPNCTNETYASPEKKKLLSDSRYVVLKRVGLATCRTSGWFPFAQFGAYLLPKFCWKSIIHFQLNKGERPLRSWKNAIFKLNFRNFVHSFCQHFTENPLFFSNEILAIIMSIPPTFFHFSLMIKYWPFSYLFSGGSRRITLRWRNSSVSR